MTTPALCDDTLDLLNVCEETARARLIASGLGVLLPGEKVADLFCGAGGWGEGAREMGIKVDFAVNHDPVAIGTHEANNPGCKHHKGDAWRTKPRDVVGDAPLGILFASAACTTHSRARGSAPISKRVHMLGWCIARWMEEVGPRIVMIENVPEWKDWGPTIDVDGLRKQDPARKGQHFRRWWRYCERLGYRMEMRVLDAPDYGAACRRKRLFIIARRDGQPICWPEKTHGVSKISPSVKGVHRGTSDGTRNSDGRLAACDESVQRARHGDGSFSDPRFVGYAENGSGSSDAIPFSTAAECIDWSDLGTSIFDRKRPLRPKTLARIAEGIRRYVLNDPSPFVLRVTHGEGSAKVSGSDGPLPTQTTRQDLGVVTPVIAVCAHGDGKDGTKRWGKPALRADDPLNAIHAGGNNFGLATPVLQVIRGEIAGKDVREPMPTITAGNGPGRGAGAAHAMGIATPILASAGAADLGPARVDRPLGTILTRDGRALVTAFLANNTTHHTGGKVDDPMPTVTTGGQAAIVAPVMAYMRHGGGQHSKADAPMLGMTAGGNHAMLVAALLTEFYGNGGARKPSEPMGAVTTLDRHGLVVCVIDGAEYVIVDILFRMLRPGELAKAMGFRPDFAWPKSQRATVRLIGNAVSPIQAKALIAAVLPGSPQVRGVA